MQEIITKTQTFWPLKSVFNILMCISYLYSIFKNNLIRLLLEGRPPSELLRIFVFIYFNQSILNCPTFRARYRWPRSSNKKEQRLSYLRVLVSPFNLNFFPNHKASARFPRLVPYLGLQRTRRSASYCLRSYP